LTLTNIETMINSAEAEGVPAEQIEQQRGQLEQQRAWTDEQYAQMDSRWDAAEAEQAGALNFYRRGVETLRSQRAEVRRLRTELLIRDGLGGPLAASDQPAESARDDDDTSS
jgi:hypothetical protein